MKITLYWVQILQVLCLFTGVIIFGGWVRSFLFGTWEVAVSGAPFFKVLIDVSLSAALLVTFLTLASKLVDVFYTSFTVEKIEEAKEEIQV